MTKSTPKSDPETDINGVIIIFPNIQITIIVYIIMTKNHRRRSIKGYFQNIHGGFCGWGELQKVTEKLEAFGLYERRDIFIALFQLGCRAKELGTLRRRQVDLDYSADNIMVRNMFVEKQRVSLKDAMADPTNPDYAHAFRTFPIRKDNPLALVFMERIKAVSLPRVLSDTYICSA